MKRLLLLAVTALLLTTGCTANAESPVLPQVEPSVTTPEPNYNVVGEIIELGENSIHVLSGDMVQIYKVDGNQLADFFVGQTVELVAANDDSYDVIEAENVNFEVRFTTMGERIETLSGVVESYENNLLTVKADDVLTVIEVSEEMNFETGTAIEVDYFKMGDNQNVYLSSLNPESKIDLKIETITRTDDGVMLLSLIDGDGAPYTMPVQGAAVHFKMSELKVGFELTVYHGGIMESYPMQISPLKIVLK